MTAETMLFWTVGPLIVVCAIGVVASTRAVYSALFLATTMILLAVSFAAQGALFLSVVQVVVYTGAVMMLFLFVLMLIGVDSADSLVETIRGQRVTVIAVGLAFALLLASGIGSLVVGPAAALPAGNVEGLAVLIFTRYLWAFELTSALLITAALGAMVLAHRERFDRRKSQRELAIERFAAGNHPTPLPNPGVYARHNAVDVPARLPDGSDADVSVSAVLPRRTATAVHSDGAAKNGANN